MKKSYYEKQLERLNGTVSVRFISDNGETNWLNLNYECCKAIAKTTSALHKKGQIIILGAPKK